jgi:hypothetical protein
MVETARIKFAFRDLTSASRASGDKTDWMTGNGFVMVISSYYFGADIFYFRSK